MARRTMYTAAKRQKERERTVKAEAKRARREGREAAPGPTVPPSLDEMVERLGQELVEHGHAPAAEPSDQGNGPRVDPGQA